MTVVTVVTLGVSTRVNWLFSRHQGLVTPTPTWEVRQRMNDAEQLQAILEQHPALHDFGYGGRTLTPESRAALLANVAAFVAARQWIADNLTPIQGINPRHSSYGLKHLFDADTGHYATNGCFIAAMLACGFQMEKHPRYNPCFNVCERSVRIAEDKVNQPAI